MHIFVLEPMKPVNMNKTMVLSGGKQLNEYDNMNKASRKYLSCSSSLSIIKLYNHYNANT